MERRPIASLLLNSPTMVGAITTMIVVVAVFLAYNANNGLPFVPVYRVSIDVPNAARLVGSNEVRIGGHRVGVVESTEVVPARDSSGGTVARLDLKLDRTAGPLPQDSIFHIRYLSTFGLKYVEIVRGTGPPAPDGFVFDGTDDRGVCKLPVNLRTFSRRIPDAARNGCFQPQAEFDDLGNLLDRRARDQARTALLELGNALAGRGGDTSEAIAAARPLMRDLTPVARTLAARSTQLARWVRAVDQASSALAPVAPQLAESFTGTATAFEAIARDPSALAATISEAAPLLDRGTGQVRRAGLLLDDVAELERRLGPGAAALRPTLPVLRRALAIGTPTLERVPGIGGPLRAALVQLRALIDQPTTKIDLQRLRETFDQAAPTATWVAPAQTVCNYWNYMFTFLAEHLSQRSSVGFTQRNVISVPYPTNPGAVSVNGVVVRFPASYSPAPITGYTGLPADGLAGVLPNPAEAGVFDPHRLPIGHGPINAPHGQLTPGYPDCGAGQFGYPLGQLLLPGQPVNEPGIAVGDYPGSLGPTTAFWRRNGTRVLRDTRVPSRAPTTWEAGR